MPEQVHLQGQEMFVLSSAETWGQAQKFYIAEHTSFGRGRQLGHKDVPFSGAVVMPEHPFFLPENGSKHSP